MDFYFSELFSAKHPYLLSKKGSWLNHWFVMQMQQGTQSEQFIAKLATEHDFYIRCKPFFATYLKMCQKSKRMIPEESRV
jgi:hypothetical protein